MAFVVWTDELSVGIEAIDEQHRELLRIMNALAMETSAQNGRVTLAKALADLVEYTKYHFRYEEKLIGNLVPQEVPKHLLLHQEFIGRLAELQSAFERAPTETVSAQTLQFLRDWLLRHIAGADKAVISKAVLSAELLRASVLPPE